MNKNYLILFLLLFSILPFAMAEPLNSTEANCTEQLQLVVDQYNDLLMDFRNGTNCGTAFNLVKDLNKELVQQRDDCIEDLDSNPDFKLGFLIMFVLLVISILINFSKNIKDGKRKK